MPSGHKISTCLKSPKIIWKGIYLSRHMESPRKQSHAYTEISANQLMLAKITLAIPENLRCQTFSLYTHIGSSESIATIAETVRPTDKLLSAYRHLIDTSTPCDPWRSDRSDSNERIPNRPPPSDSDHRRRCQAN